MAVGSGEMPSRLAVLVGSLERRLADEEIGPARERGELGGGRRIAGVRENLVALADAEAVCLHRVVRERVRVDVKARYGGNSGKFLAKLNDKGEYDMLVPLALPADFFWRQKIAFAPGLDNLVNSLDFASSRNKDSQIMLHIQD
jgi:hypothetical protein